MGVTNACHDRRSHGRVAALHEPDEPSFQRDPLKQDVSAAGLAAQPDVRTESIQQPGIAAARMRALEANDVAEQQVEDGSGRHGGNVAEPWYQSRGRPAVGTRFRCVAGMEIASAGVTSTMTSG